MYNVHVCPTVRKCLFQSSNTSKLAKSKVQNCCVQKGTFMAMLNRDVQKRIFTNFKTLGDEFSIYGPTSELCQVYQLGQVL